MGDVFLTALARELATTQRVLPSSVLFCVPQERSLVADAALSQDELFTHLLTPLTDSDAQHKPGAYETLNGKSVAIVGSQIHTQKGFEDKRKVRILLSEPREINHQQVTVLHLSRPLVGGIVLPEDPNEIDLATFRRYTAMLRAFPENELVFLHLDETVAQVKKICRQNQFVNRYEATLPAILKEEWEYAVEEIARSGSFEDDDDNGSSVSHRRPYAASGVGHLLAIQQVVECFLMEQLHKSIFPRVLVSCKIDDKKLSGVLWQMRHYGPVDFGLRKEFQCHFLQARVALHHIEKLKTPLEMLLAFKACIDGITEAITRNLKLHHHGLDGYEMTTDDLLDALLFVLVQAYNHAAEQAAKEDDRELPHFPLVAVLKYVTDYHFINSNTSALGYTIANFEVAVEYFMIKATHSQSCRVCYNLGSRRRADWNSWEDATEEQCSQAIVPAGVQVAFTKNYSTWLAAKVRRSRQSPGPVGAVESEGQKLYILGEWSADEDAEEETQENRGGSALPHHEVQLDGLSSVTQVSCGHRFFAIANDEGQLFTWGDRSGARLGYTSVQGDSRRVMQPRVVPALQQLHVLQVACGAFHTLVTDVNGHVFAWGQNARGQLGFLTHSAETTTVVTPTLVSDLKGVYVSAVACGEYHSLGLSSGGRVFSWGCNKFSKLGRPTEGLLDAVQPKSLDAQWIPKSINRIHRLDDDLGMPIGSVRRIAAGRDHSMAVTCDGAVFTWGRGDAGQLGHGSFMDVVEPMQVLALADDDCAMKIADVSAGGNFSLFLLRDGAVFITGKDPSKPANDSGSLVPEMVELPDAETTPSWIAVAAGESHLVLVSKVGDVYVSDATTGITRSTATPGAVRVRAGASHTLVLSR